MELAYCHERGIPHSRFLEEWDPEDRAKVAAFSMEQAERCSMCGTSPWEWAEDPYAYEPHHQVCFGCQRKELLRDDDEKPPAGSSVVLIPRRVAVRMREEQRRESE